MDLSGVVSRNPNAAYRVYDGRAVIVLPERGENHLLNEIGSLIWDRLDGRRTLAEVLGAVVTEFDVPEETARRDLVDFIEALRLKGMVQAVDCREGAR